MIIISHHFSSCLIVFHLWSPDQPVTLKTNFAEAIFVDEVLEKDPSATISESNEVTSLANVLKEVAIDAVNIFETSRQYGWDKFPDLKMISPRRSMCYMMCAGSARWDHLVMGKAHTHLCNWKWCYALLGTVSPWHHQSTIINRSFFIIMLLLHWCLIGVFFLEKQRWSQIDIECQALWLFIQLVCSHCLRIFILDD